MINSNVILNFDITLKKNNRRIKFECRTDKFNYVSTNVYIHKKPTDNLNHTDLLKEQLTDFGFDKEEIKTFILFKNYQATDINNLIIERDKYIYIIL